MKKNWGSALFPLAILLVLTGLTFWLQSAVQMPEEKHDGKNRHDPDYTIQDFQLRKLDRTGRLQYALTAPDLQHFPDKDTTEVKKPHLVYLHPIKPTMTVTSDTALIGPDGKEVFLKDDVRLKRNGTPTQEPIYATMPDLTVHPDDEYAFTKSPVLMTQGKSWLKGVGMQVDNKSQTYVLQSQALGQFESKHTKKP